jgi:small-conductance mechanosensitive channel
MGRFFRLIVCFRARVRDRGSAARGCGDSSARRVRHERTVTGCRSAWSLVREIAAYQRGLVVVRPQDDAVPPVYPQSKKLLLDARFVLVAWALLALFPLVYFSLRLTGAQSIAVPSFILFAFLWAVVAHVALSLSHRCPACRKHPTIQGFKAPHPRSVEQSAVAGWAGAVVNVLRRRQLVCIHCGAAFQVGA